MFIWIAVADLILIFLMLVCILRKKSIIYLLFFKIITTLLIVPLIADLYYAKHGGVDEYRYTKAVKYYAKQEDIPLLRFGFSWGTYNFESLNTYIVYPFGGFFEADTFWSLLFFLRLFNSLIGAFGIILLWKMVVNINPMFDRPTLFLLLLNPIFWTSMVLKESISFLFTVYFLYIVWILNKKRFTNSPILGIHLFMFTFCFIVATSVRPWIPFLLFGAFTIYNLLSLRFVRFALSLMPALVIFAIMGKTINQLLEIPVYMYKVTKGSDITILQAIANGFLGILRPFPWEIKNIFQAVKTVYIFTVLILVLRVIGLNFRRVLNSIQAFWDNPAFGVAFVYTIIWFFTLGAVASYNSGLYIRAFSQVIPGILIIIAFISTETRKSVRSFALSKV